VNKHTKTVAQFRLKRAEERENRQLSTLRNPIKPTGDDRKKDKEDSSGPAAPSKDNGTMKKKSGQKEKAKKGLVGKKRNVWLGERKLEQDAGSFY